MIRNRDEARGAGHPAPGEGAATRPAGRRWARGTRHWALVGLLGLGGCTDWAGYDLDYFWGNIEALATMRGSVAYEAYQLPRLPPEGTVPVASPMGDLPPPFTQTQLDSAAATLTNPYAGGAPAAVLARGQEKYQQQCAACHGPAGAGNGPVVGPGKYPMAPAINIPTTAARSDGYLYGVIAVGRGLMPAYGERLTHADRWAVVAYLRQLQGQGGAAPASVPGVPTVVNPPDPTAAGGAAGGPAVGGAGTPAVVNPSSADTIVR